MWPVFDQIAGNLAVTFENIILLLLFLGGLVFYAKDFKIGAMFHFFMYALAFMWFFATGRDYSNSLILMFIFLIIMSISIFAVAKTQTRAGLV